MCSILGWYGNVPEEDKLFAIKHGSLRGRDGCGFWKYGGFVGPKEEKSMSELNEVQIDNLIKSDKVVGNFRATPTTEAESSIELLQPYDGIVHNGIIANDKEFDDLPIDSMCLPKILTRKGGIAGLKEDLKKIKGSYAIAFLNGKEGLYLACNYKPIYFKLYKENSTRGDGVLFASIPEMLPEYSHKMDAYSIKRFYFKTGGYGRLLEEKLEIDRTQSKKVLVSASAGLDSTTVCYMLKEQGYQVTMAHFKYGALAQERELERINKIAEHGNFDVVVLDMPKVMGGTIVEGTYHKQEIAGTEYAHDWVSARNLLMLSILTAYAETKGYGYISFGGNLEESLPYEQEILVRNKKDRPTSLISVPIGEFVEKYEVENYYAISINKDFEIEQKRVLKGIRHVCSYSELLEFTIATGKKIVVTPCHSLMGIRENRITSIKGEELKIGDYLLGGKDSAFEKGMEYWHAAIKDIKKVKSPEFVYDISVEDNENFLLSNLVFAHNSGSYPDNEQEMGRLFNNILPYSTQNGIKIELLQPVSTLMKHEIVKEGVRLGVPYELTWSCYSNEERHCGKCGPDFMRKKSFERNGLKDPVFAHLEENPAI